jgi:hypothetical protein
MHDPVFPKKRVPFVYQGVQLENTFRRNMGADVPEKYLVETNTTHAD